MQFIPSVSPRLEPPLHLAPYVDVLERAPGADLRVAFSAPPQHGKTQATLHALVWWLIKYPHLRFAYVTYSQERAQRVSRQASWIAQQAGLVYQGTLNLWRTAEGGQVIWTSVAGPTGGGGLTGDPVDGVLIIDDPIKGRKEAESALVRESFRDWYHGTAMTRIHPGASVIVMATRWHADDPPGWLVKDQGYEHINLKAIADDDRPPGDDREPGTALWPTARPLSMLQERQQANAWNFAALYQGEPRPRGGALFREPTFYNETPSQFAITLGLDLSYTAKTRADFSVLVVIGYDRGKWYVLDVIRKQVEAPEFAMALSLKAQQYPRSGLYWYASGTEKGAAQFMQRKGIAVRVRDPRGRDKLTRAQAAAEAWNLGNVLLPYPDERAPWVDAFIDEVCAFTGVKDVHDDQVDAFVSAFDGSVAEIAGKLPDAGPREDLRGTSHENFPKRFVYEPPIPQHLQQLARNWNKRP